MSNIDIENKTNKIRKQYLTKKPDELDKLKKLDKKVKVPVYVFAYIYGIIGALILGMGMCLAMHIMGDSVALMIAGIVIGGVGIIMISLTSLIFSKMLAKRKAKFKDEILSLSDKILNK